MGVRGDQAHMNGCGDGCSQPRKHSEQPQQRNRGQGQQESPYSAKFITLAVC